ncbi:ATP-NAD kinase [Halomicrobium salinisoli]|uniref:ATP-NAD kinase n=1 Tax=Halomicrobium salinisoli TaxID=2878391 RepID=UPI001CF0B4B2|nr:ATP-NAD kinase [Halomicrobium salinisoli]
MDEEPVVGVVGEAPDLRDALEAVDAAVVAGDAETVLAADPSIVVAVGEQSTLDVAHRAPPAPILPVDAGRGLRSVAAADLPGVADALAAGEWDVERHPLLAVELDGERVARALSDVTLVSAEVARISEFSVVAGDVDVAQVRADGVVVATPAGSTEYARRIDAPVLAPDTGVAAVAPIAPFATDPDQWVLPLASLRLRVERDEAPVTLVADGEEVSPVGVDEPVALRPTGRVEIAVTGASAPRFP